MTVILLFYLYPVKRRAKIRTRTVEKDVLGLCGPEVLGKVGKIGSAAPRDRGTLQSIHPVRSRTPRHLHPAPLLRRDAGQAQIRMRVKRVGPGLVFRQVAHPVSVR